MTKILVLCVIQLLIGMSVGQEGFKVIIEKIEIISYRKDYVEDPRHTLVQWNQTHQAMSGSGKLLKDLGMDLKEEAEIFSVENGKTSLMTTAKEIGICELLTSGIPEFEELFKFGNFTKCPMLAGYYEIKNAVIDMSSIPPGIPRGHFIIDVRTFDNGTEFFRTKSYLLVQDDPPTTA